MTLVNLNCIFDTDDFLESVTEIYDTLPANIKKIIDDKLASPDAQENLNSPISNYTFLNGLLDS
jgi:hypothetical protein